MKNILKIALFLGLSLISSSFAQTVSFDGKCKVTGGKIRLDSVKIISEAGDTLLTLDGYESLDASLLTSVAEAKTFENNLKIFPGKIHFVPMRKMSAVA